MFKRQKSTKGITLVALVVTIIILLILAGITISQLSGSGLFEKAKLAEQKSKDAQEKEEGILGDYENKIGQYVDSTREQITVDKEEYEKLKADVQTLKRGINYSDEEVKTNDTWNGKPIYTKTICVDALPNTTTTYYAHNIENVDIIWFDASNCFGIWSNGNIASIPFVSTSGETMITIHGANETQFGITTGMDRSSIAGYITLRYTKTTD